MDVTELHIGQTLRVKDIAGQEEPVLVGERTHLDLPRRQGAQPRQEGEQAGAGADLLAAIAEQQKERRRPRGAQEIEQKGAGIHVACGRQFAGELSSVGLAAAHASAH